MPVMLQASAAAEEDRRAREARGALAASQERCQALQAECSAHSAKLKELQSKHKVRNTSFTLCSRLLLQPCQSHPVYKQSAWLRCMVAVQRQCALWTELCIASLRALPACPEPEG